MAPHVFVDYPEFFDNARKLKALVAEIEAPYAVIVDDDADRWPGGGQSAEQRHLRPDRQ